MACPLEFRQSVREYFGGLQDSITSGLEKLDGKARFREDRWTYGDDEAVGDGGGITRVIASGDVFEKGGVNLSEVAGELTERLAKRLDVDAERFYANGGSLVLHPASPMVPIVHLNLRYLEVLGDGGQPVRAWFGGGSDLTPFYLFDEDATHFHQVWKSVCDRHDPAYYERFKQRCDEYFFIKHRRETRGVGGIFFDYLDRDLDRVFAFVRDVGDTFLKAYGCIVSRRREEPWTDRERDWQLVRRGRYVEFNLIYDRGTRFGLETGGRTESILMSLPPVVNWSYDHRPESGSREEQLLETLRHPRSWV